MGKKIIGKQAHVHNGKIAFVCPNCGHFNEDHYMYNFKLLDSCEKCFFSIRMIVIAYEINDEAVEDHFKGEN